MSKADKMFEKLKYEKKGTDEIIIYKQYNLLLPTRTITIFKETKAVIIKNADGSTCFIIFEEIDAVNQKLKEV